MLAFGLVSLILNFFSPLELDLELTNKELSEMRGYNYEFHEALTDDRYFLGMHRITKNRTNGHPVLLIHGLFVNSRCWFLVNESLPLMLADLGYDVWLGDFRGNPPNSLKHQNFSMYDERFWNFSFHEMGTHDVPAMIDFILNMTNQNKLSYVGLSLGTTIYFTLLSEREEYNKKISSGTLLVPYIPSTDIKNYTPFFRLILKSLKTFLEILKSIRFKNWDFKPYAELLRNTLARICSKRTRGICYKLLDLSFGGNTTNLDLKTLGPTVKASIGFSSLKTTEHCIQMMFSGRFQKFDYGKAENIELYGSESPPEYNLTKIDIPTAYFYSDTDVIIPYKTALRAIRLIRKVEPHLFPGFSHIEMALGPRSVQVYRKTIEFIGKNVL